MAEAIFLGSIAPPVLFPEARIVGRIPTKEKDSPDTCRLSIVTGPTAVTPGVAARRSTSASVTGLRSELTRTGVPFRIP